MPKLTVPVSTMMPLVMGRLAKGMSQRDIAEQIGRHQTHVSHMETGRAALTMGDMEAYARVVNLKMNVSFTPENTSPFTD